MDDYTVELDSFRGPLDLLLFLVKRNEVDIFDIPIARITDQFLVFVNHLQTIDVEWAGEFLVMAATLMEIKSRMLLPRQEEEQSQDDDPRLELVKQLIEYKKYKEAAALLDEQAQRQMTRLPRLAEDTVVSLDPARQPLRRVELWDLVSAFGRLMRETSALQPRQIIVDETPIQVHMDRILDLVAHRGRIAFSEVFIPPHTRGRLLGIFLAILELIKGKKLVAEQPEAFGNIWLALVPCCTDEAGPP
ncbi:MAG: segregation/condensation protein A [Planctomycetes bacterium]|nr:segregation/condensation protein A [Planctomycetota bacterium]